MHLIDQKTFGKLFVQYKIGTISEFGEGFRQDAGGWHLAVSAQCERAKSSGWDTLHDG